MIDYFPEPLALDPRLLRLLLVGIAAVIAFGIGRFIPPAIQPLLRIFISPKAADIYQTIVDPYKTLFGITIAFGITEVAAIVFQARPWIEVPISLLFTITVAWLVSRFLRQFFDVYLLDLVVQKGGKVNELLILGKLFAYIIVVFVAIFVFAESHDINLFGLLASLGIGGLAVAFAAQKTLEQVLGGIVIYIDRPFVVDDYVGLPDGTFGRVESIGLRSTKIRSTGKGTLIIVPNSGLTQMTIENFTGAKKVMAIIYLNFYQIIPGEERALIQQTIVESTTDIFGIDSRNTDVTYRDITDEDGKKRTQAQITFFILGSGDVSMELRRQVLGLANKNINQKLQEYGISFDIEEPTIYVDSPITI